MSFRTAVSALSARGAAENARRSLDEWDRAQAEVSALLERIGKRRRRSDTPAPDTASPASPDSADSAVPRLLRRPDPAA
jgi:hypothetical protein